MTDQPEQPDDRELEQYLAGQHPLSARYREAKAVDTPPPELEAIILATARTSAPRRRSVRRWAMPVGLAASLMIAGPLVWQVWQSDELHDTEFAYPASSPIAVMAEQAEGGAASETRDVRVKAEMQAMARAESHVALSQRQAQPRALASARPSVTSASPPNMAEDEVAAPTDAESEEPVPPLFFGFGSALFGDDEQSVRTAWGRPLEVRGSNPEACRQLFAVPQFESGISFMLVNGRFARYDVTGPQFEAPGGIRVGDAREKLEARYEIEEMLVPSHKVVQGADVLTVTISPESKVRLVFEMTPKGRIEQWRLGVPPAVLTDEGCP